jgi:hypothetical protein
VRLAVEVETLDNTLDGCAECGCRVRSALETGRQASWWVSYGVVTTSAEGGWVPVASASRCGTGSFENVEPDFRRTIGFPYLVVDLSSTPTATRTGGAELKLSLKIRKFAGLDKEGRPAYSTSA